MAKRFIDTDFYTTPFIRGLEGAYKALYSFIITNADHSAIWTPDFEIACIYIGFKVDEKGAKNQFNGQYIVLENGKWFFPLMLEQQHPNGLSETNRAHTKTIEKLSKYGLIDENLNLIIKPLISPLKGSKVTVTVKAEVKAEETVIPKKPRLKMEDVIWPWEDSEFKDIWDLWCDFRKEKRVSSYRPIGLQATLKNLSELSKGDKITAIAIINQSINKGWQGLFALKNNTNGSGNSQNITDNDIVAAVERSNQANNQ